MADNEMKVVRITNISDFDFTGPLGARYGGRDYFVRAGGSLLVPFPLGDHLATHLARQILIKKAPIRDAKETDGKGSDRPLWDDTVITELKAKIMTEVYEEEAPAAVSDADKMASRVAALNKSEKEVEQQDTGGNVDASDIVPTEDTAGETLVYKDKAQIIAELTKRGTKFNPRDTKATLEALLKP